MQDGSKNLLAGAALVAAFFLLGFFLDFITVKSVLLAFMGALAGGLLVLPYEHAIVVLFAYLGFEGGAKMLTHYNPVIHVGGDLLVVTLTARWLVTLFLKRTRLPAELPPFVALFAIHFAWFLIQFLNPYSIGLIPSIAGAKVYVTMLLLYAFGFYLGKEPRLVRRFMAVWVMTLLIQIATGLFQASVGPKSVVGLSPYYGAALAKFDAGTSFRPFGTTHLPGAPAIFSYMAFPFLLYFVIRARSILTRAFLASAVPLSVLLIMVCQIRSALLKLIFESALFLTILLSRASSQTRRRALLGIPVAATVLLLVVPQVISTWQQENPESAAGIERSLSLFNYDKVRHARAGAADRILMHAEMVPLGAGLSRTGAAAGKFLDLIQSDPYFPHGFFGDNFWAAVIAELGVPGALFLTSIIALVLIRGATGLIAVRDPERRLLIAAILCPLVAIVLGLWGAEGLLYNPEAPFFWFFSGVMMQLVAKTPDSA